MPIKTSRHRQGERLDAARALGHARIRVRDQRGFSPIQARSFEPAVPRGLPAAPTPEMVDAVAPLLSDPVRAVRIETARVLAGVDQHTLTPEQQTAFAAAYLELFDAEMVDAERPEAHLNLGLMETKLRHPAEAEDQYPQNPRYDFCSRKLFRLEGGSSALFVSRSGRRRCAMPCDDSFDRIPRLFGAFWPRLHRSHHQVGASEGENAALVIMTFLA